MNKQTAYDRYKTKVQMARNAGFSDRAIIDELNREMESIKPRCIMKQMTLAQDRNIYKKREVARAAQECINAITKIIDELTPKEISA